MQQSSDATAPIVGIGNAIVDVIAESEPGFLSGQGLVPGSMNLIDSDRAHELYDLMGPAIETSGGSVGKSQKPCFVIRGRVVSSITHQSSSVLGNDTKESGNLITLQGNDNYNRLYLIFLQNRIIIIIDCLFWPETHNRN